MNQPRAFHDGNIVSFGFSGPKATKKCKIVLDLYDDDVIAKYRRRHVFTFRKLRNVSFTGDFVEIANNYWAGSIVDGMIEDCDGFQRLSMQLTGGALAIEGVLEIVVQELRSGD